MATDELKAYSSPVLYLSVNDFKEYFKSIVEAMMQNAAMIEGMGRDTLREFLFILFKSSLLCTKHPGFKEEREWRIFYTPTQDRSPIINEDVCTVDGVPQGIFKIPLEHNPGNGLFHADVPSLIDRIIIGPTEYPVIIYNTLVAALEKAGVSDARKRIVVSDIPLRLR